MLRAVFVNVKSGGDTRQGASTLTQQLARSGLLGIGQEQTLTRKGKEIIYALLIEARYDKRTILADDKLKPVFGADSVGMFKLAGIAGGHLTS